MKFDVDYYGIIKNGVLLKVKIIGLGAIQKTILFSQASIAKILS